MTAVRATTSDNAATQAAAAADERAAVLRIAAALAPLAECDQAALAPVLDALRFRSLAAGEMLVRIGEPGERECFVLHGVIGTWVGDAQGREVMLALHEGPAALAPAVGRVAQGRSRVNCQALTAARVAEFPAATLLEGMLRHPAIQRWGDAVLRAELLRRADREWALAALPAAERLARLRALHPGLEDRITHRHIASYLGITPVSLSRLRARARPR